MANICKHLNLEPPFAHRAGAAWAAHLHDVAWPSDGSEHPRRSLLVLWENDVQLGPPHSLHHAIEGRGAGRYSHWAGNLIFSASDGSDPNTNGRRYRVSLGEAPIRAIGLGSCHLHSALAELEEKALVDYGRASALAGSPREAAQILAFHLSELDIPPALRWLTVADSELTGADPAECSPRPDRVKQPDVAFFEFGSNVDISYGPFWLLRAPLRSRLMDRLAALGTEHRNTAYRWYNQGLMKRKETVRQECAERMVDVIPSLGFSHPDLVIDVVRNARGVEQDVASVADTMRQLRDTLQARATCVLSSQNAFMPDGRALSWPGNFFKVIEVACTEVGLPLLHTKTLVAEQGVAFALTKDMAHFTPQMISLLAGEILAMGQRALEEPAATAPLAGNRIRTSSSAVQS